MNDADAAGLAEVRLGAGRDVRGTVLMLTVGTGIGSGLFVNGELVPEHGARPHRGQRPRRRDAHQRRGPRAPPAALEGRGPREFNEYLARARGIPVARSDHPRRRRQQGHGQVPRPAQEPRADRSRAVPQHVGDHRRGAQRGGPGARRTPADVRGIGVSEASCADGSVPEAARPPTPSRAATRRPRPRSARPPDACRSTCSTRPTSSSARTSRPDHRRSTLTGIRSTRRSGIIESTLYLFREEGVTHLGCAADHVIESWRNSRWPGYKTSYGVPRELLDQFTLAEDALRALGVVVWPLVEWEADDGLGTAAARWADAPGVERVVIMTPDKDMGQCVREDGKVVQYDRRQRLLIDADGVRKKFGVSPESIPDLPGAGRRLGRRLPGHPRLGQGLSRRGPDALRTPRGHPRKRQRTGTSASAARPRSRPRCASTARRRTSSASWRRSLLDVPLPETLDDLRWRGAHRAEFTAIAERLGQPQLDRPRPQVGRLGGASRPWQSSSRSRASWPSWRRDQRANRANRGDRDRRRTRAAGARSGATHLLDRAAPIERVPCGQASNVRHRSSGKARAGSAARRAGATTRPPRCGHRIVLDVLQVVAFLQPAATSASRSLRVVDAAPFLTAHVEMESRRAVACPPRSCRTTA